MRPSEEPKTMLQVFEIAKIAVENKIPFKFLKTRSMNCYTGIVIDETMSPTQMFDTINKRLEENGIRVYAKLTRELEEYVLSLIF